MDRKRLQSIERIIQGEHNPTIPSTSSSKNVHRMDGGNMEILDIVESPPHHDLYIRYLGACSGCSAGSMGTLYAIESILQSKVNENIRVLPI